MGILDRHIAWRYMVNIVALFAALFSFVVAIDIFVNLRDYGRAAESLAGGEGADAGSGKLMALTLLAIVDLWGPRLLQLFNYMMGVVLVAAMGFTCAAFVRHREYIAAIASGRSLYRLARPIMLVALGVTALGAVNQELLLPRVAHLLPRVTHEAGGRSIQSIRVPPVRDGASRLLYAARFDAETETMERLHVWERDATGQVVRRIWADRAVWDGDAWLLENGQAERASAPNRIEPVERVQTDLDPTAILVSQIQGYGHALSWSQISAAIARSDNVESGVRERMDRLRFGRLSVMLSNLLALVVAMPFFLVREPKNMLTQSLKCAPLALAALIGAVIGSTAPMPGLPTWLGVFVPTFVLAPIAIWAVVSVRS
ncbi:MAG: LptF/LptG family permease [Phycisphaeraceae bacterium]|nr:MAG: LptF/LptG family permease [Phycisphaeraceae bacterium]